MPLRGDQSHTEMALGGCCDPRRGINRPCLPLEQAAACTEKHPKVIRASNWTPEEPLESFRAANVDLRPHALHQLSNMFTTRTHDVFDLKGRWPLRALRQAAAPVGITVTSALSQRPRSCRATKIPSSVPSSSWDRCTMRITSV